MTRELCRGLPAEYWDSDHEGARLAIAICRRCPAQPTCLAGDPKPMGVVRAGVAFSDAGTPIRPCPSCGYPQVGRASTASDRCVRCDLPPVSKWRSDIQRWVADGVSVEEAGRRIGVTPREIRVMLRPAGTSGRKADDGSESGELSPFELSADIDEAMVEWALKGGRPVLTDFELLSALRAGKARGMSMPVLADLLGINVRAAYRLLRSGATPRRAKHAAMVAALRLNPGGSTRSIAAQVGVDRETVRRARRQLEQQLVAA